MAEENAAGVPAGERINRRRALQLGAAAGVGVAAWTGPQIGRFGAAPAYAAVCSPGEEDCSVAGPKSVNWGSTCPGNGQNATADYGLLNANSLSVDGQTINISQTGTCTDGNSTVNITGSLSGITCLTTLTFFLQSDNSVVDSVSVGGTGMVTVPARTKGQFGNGSLKVSLAVCCSSDEGCDNLPD